MSDFATQIAQFGQKALAKADAVFVRTGDLALQSVVVGHPATGAPGQPVVSGELRDSWRIRREGQAITVSTPLFYAPWIEDGVRGETPIQDGPSPGGPHSVKLTVAGMPRLVEQAVREVVGA